ncbi:MAG: methyltransferase domain-containing protein [Microthrixaceae bacterium]
MARGYVRVRQAIAPVTVIDELVPAQGRILEYGCGMGVVAVTLGLGAPDRFVDGVDLAASRIDVARAAAAAAGLSGRVSFQPVEEDWVPPVGAYDAVVVVDVLYLLGPDAVQLVTGRLIAALRPGGRLVVKEVGTTPAWKRRAGRAQEFLAVRALRFTRGSTLNADPLRSVRAAVASAGLDSRSLPLDRGYYYPHEALTVDVPAE